MVLPFLALYGLVSGGSCGMVAYRMGGIRGKCLRFGPTCVGLLGLMNIMMDESRRAQYW